MKKAPKLAFNFRSSNTLKWQLQTMHCFVLPEKNEFILCFVLFKQNQFPLCFVLFKQNQFTLCFILFNLYNAYVTILGPLSFPPMPHLCAQIRELYCKNEGCLFWEEGKAIFCTQHEKLFYFILQKTGKELVLK